MDRRPRPIVRVAYAIQAGVLGVLGLGIGFLGPLFLSLLLFNNATRRTYDLAFQLVCWSGAIVGAVAGVKATHLHYRRHFPAPPGVGDPRQDYDDGQRPAGPE